MTWNVSVEIYTLRRRLSLSPTGSKQLRAEHDAHSAIPLPLSSHSPDGQQWMEKFDVGSRSKRTQALRASTPRIKTRWLECSNSPVIDRPCHGGVGIERKRKEGWQVPSHATTIRYPRLPRPAFYRSSMSESSGWTISCSIRHYSRQVVEEVEHASCGDAV